MIFIGDVHGKYERYKRIMDHCSDSIQVGDMGVGFRRIQSGYGHPNEFYPNPPHYAMLRGKHRFIRGNHDNPTECKKHSQWIPDGHVEGNMMFVGGAVSIDREFRYKDYDWWEDEELSQKELDKLVEKYCEVRPEIMVTHDCPEELAKSMEAMFCRGKINIPSRTRIALQRMWSAHQPRVWVYGHWHHSFDHVVNGTRFVCLAELEAKEID